MQINLMNALDRSVAAQRYADTVADWRTERAAWLAAFDETLENFAGEAADKVQRRTTHADDCGCNMCHTARNCY